MPLPLPNCPTCTTADLMAQLLQQARKRALRAQGLQQTLQPLTKGHKPKPH